MSFDHLFQVLNSIQPLSPPFKAALEKEIVPLSLPKDHKLLEVSQVAHQVYFLHQGFALTYSFVDGRKYVEQFWGGGQLIVSLRSFFERTPALEFIQLAVASDVLCISYERMMALMDDFPEANYIFQIMIGRCYEEQRLRVRDLQYKSTTALFQKLLRHHPEIEQLVSQDLIASYLGIAPQSLSRMKRNIDKS